jgi:crossover junction endodeoxyribonuclease RuvC
MIIMGIDPGIAITGYGVLEYDSDRFRVIDFGAVTTDSKTPLPLRLKYLFNQLNSIILRTNPDQFAMEELFFNKNVRTALTVGHGRGVAMLSAAMAGLEVFEYTPLQVKLAVVGEGRAEKGQVQFMVRALLSLRETPRPDDVADALAVAICHAYHAGGMGVKFR